MRLTIREEGSGVEKGDVVEGMNYYVGGMGMKGKILIGKLLIIGLLIVLAAAGCKTSPLGRMAVQRFETWQVGGKTYKNLSTYYEYGLGESPEYGSGNLVLYVVEFPVPDEKLLFGINENRARSIAWPLLRFVWENRKHERTAIPPVRGSVPPMVRIAINLVAANHRDLPGYRVVVSIGEIVACIKQGDQCKYPGEPH